MDLLNSIDPAELNLLIKIHNGHEMFKNNLTDDGSPSEASSDPYKPQLYTFEELANNLVDSSQYKVTGLEEGSSFAQDESPTPAVIIAEKLKSLITQTHCYICEKQGEAHYNGKFHVKKLIRRINQEQKELGSIEPVEKIYCRPCNLLLTKQYLGEDHYSSPMHYNNEKNYCDLCLKLATNIEEHVLTKEHKNKEKLSKVPCEPQILPPEDVSSTTDINLIADEFNSLVTPDFCHLCQKHGGSHYQDSLHRKRVQDWLRKRSTVDVRVPENQKTEACHETLQLVSELITQMNTLYSSKSVHFATALTELRELNRKIRKMTME